MRNYSNRNIQTKFAIRLRAHARQMRHHPTASEHVLWQLLRRQQLGVAFRRQQIIGHFVVDFLARKPRLIVEVDGGYHAEVAAADARRERWLTRSGYAVVRVSAEEVLATPLVAIERILAALGGVAE